MRPRSKRDPCDVPRYKTEAVLRLKARLPSPGVVDDVARMFQVLSDPTRIRLIATLSSGEELCVCDVANVVGLTMSATSHQLKKLREAGIVTHRTDGRMAYYRLRDGFSAGLLAQARVHVENGPA